MRINFTGRRKIDKQDARISIIADPICAYFEIALNFQPYAKLPSNALVFLEAYRKLELMRFKLGTVGKSDYLSPADRRLSEITDHQGIKFRVKVTQPDGIEAGKLLAEADGLRPFKGDDGQIPLIALEGADDLGQTPWELELEPTDPDLPTLRINNKIGGKQRGDDQTFRALVLPPVVREVFTQMIINGVEVEDPEHWTVLWSRLATEVLKQTTPPHGNELNDAALNWVKEATKAFSEQRHLVERLTIAQPEWSSI